MPGMVISLDVEVWRRAKGLGLNCRGFPPKARRRSADRRHATFKFIYASGGRGGG